LLRNNTAAYLLKLAKYEPDLVITKVFVGFMHMDFGTVVEAQEVPMLKVISSVI
jgi:hypothetical protein